MDTTDIEKKSLEAHVELCAERYRLLETKLATVESDVTEVKGVVTDTHALVHAMAEKRADQIMAWGTGIIAALIGAVIWLAMEYFKAP